MHAQKQVSVSLRGIEFYFILFQAINAKMSIFTHWTNSDLNTMLIHCQTIVLGCKCEQPSLIVTSIKTRDVYIHIYNRFRQLSKASAMYRNFSWYFRKSWRMQKFCLQLVYRSFYKRTTFFKCFKLKHSTETLQYILASTKLDTINTCSSPVCCYRGNIVNLGKVLYSSCVISPPRG